MLGVYLIHENPTLYPWLWKTVFNINEHLNEPYFIPYALGVTTVVFYYLYSYRNGKRTLYEEVVQASPYAEACSDRLKNSEIL